MKRILWTLYVLLLAAQLSLAQYTSGVEGTALDQTGLALANAKVLVTNEATQVTRETTTNSSGYFRASELLPGTYRVQVQLAGFQNWVESSVQIDAIGNSKSSSRSDFLTGIFPVSAFPLPSPGQEGNLGRNTFEGPGSINVKLNIVKNTKVPWFVREGAVRQIRGEVFNLWNRVNLLNPVGDLSSSLFGRSTSQNLPRSVTLGARIQF